MRKKYRIQTLRKIGLLQMVIAAVFLLTMSRGNYLRNEDEQEKWPVEHRICFGWLLEEMPAFQKQSERPGLLDGFYGTIVPSMTYSFNFCETIDYENDGPKMELKEKTFEDPIWLEQQISLENQQYEPLVRGKRKELKPFGLTGLREELLAEETVSQPQKIVTYTKEDFASYEELMKNFYVVDPSTSASADMMNIESFLSKDMSIDPSIEGPQILIYHTHSQEGFADSVSGDPSTTIVGAGEYLRNLLEGYGFSVIHETGEYDIASRSTAYSNIQPVLEQYLNDYPGIQVMIDLHRDEVKEGKLVTTVNGKETAKFMFFNGLSYLNGVGQIAYLQNPNIEDNLAFAFQLQYLTNQYYPGLARKIYLKGYRYNLHYRPKSLLIELGAQTNTREEIWNACEPLAEIIARVLSGEK